MKRLLSLGLALTLVLITSPLIFSATATETDQSLQRLKDGNEHYVQLQLLHPNQTQERRMLTAQEGQRPFATVLSCSDSRVPVEMVFDQGIGDLFVVRVAGNIAGTSEIGTAEYGVEHLHTPLLVVLGHTKCGAITAAVMHAEAHGKLGDLLEAIAPVVAHVESEHPELKGNALVGETTRANVRHTIRTLLESPVLKQEAEEGKLTVVGAIYDVSTGAVEWLKEE